LKQLTCVMACDGAPPPAMGGSGVINVPFFVVYFKNGKRVIFQNQSSGIQYIKGQKVLFYYSLDAFDYPQNNENLREVACPILVPDSDVPDPGDQVQYITVQSDSAFAAQTFSGVISEFGFKFINNTVQYELVAPVSGGGSGSDVNITNSFLDCHSTLYLNGTPVADGTNALPVAVNGTVVISPLDTLDVNVVNTSIPITNTNVDSLTFTTDKGISYLNTNSMFGVPVLNGCLKSVLADGGGNNTASVDFNGALLITNPNLSGLNYQQGTAGGGYSNLKVQLFTENNPISSTAPLPTQVFATPITTFAWSKADFIPTDGSVDAVSTSINTSLYNSVAVFGISTTSAPSPGPTPYLIYQWSLDGSTWYDTPYVVSLNNNLPFSDSRTLGIPFTRFKIAGYALDTLTLNICLK